MSERIKPTATKPNVADEKGEDDTNPQHRQADAKLGVKFEGSPEERAAIAEHDGGLSREDAERLADGQPPLFKPLNPVVADYSRRVAGVEDLPKLRRVRDGTMGL
jgi:hypothetical protein